MEMVPWSESADIEPPDDGPVSLGESGMLYYPPHLVRLARCLRCGDQFVNRSFLDAHLAKKHNSGPLPPGGIPEHVPEHERERNAQ